MYERNKAILERLTIELLKKTQPSKNPYMAIIGGQPGTRRAMMIHPACQQYFQDRRPVILAEEEYLYDHPLALEAFANSDKRLEKGIGRDARTWIKYLLGAVVEHRRNIALIEGMRNGEALADVIMRVRAQRYGVCLLAMAVNEEISRLELAARYERRIYEVGVAWCPNFEVHDEAYASMLRVVKFFESNESIDRIMVYNRLGEVLYDSEHRAKAATRRTSMDARTAILSERALSIPPDEFAAYARTARGVVASMRGRSAPPAEIERIKTVLAGFLGRE